MNKYKTIAVTGTELAFDEFKKSVANANPIRCSRKHEFSTDGTHYKHITSLRDCIGIMFDGYRFLFWGVIEDLSPEENREHIKIMEEIMFCTKPEPLINKSTRQEKEKYFE